MKTPEEIWKDAATSDPFKKTWMEVGIAAINEAIQQERERTCEWVCEDSYVGIGANSSCGKYRFFPYGLDAELLCCFSCGGRIKIVVKTPRTGCDFKPTSSRACEWGTHGCQVKHGGK